jgi:two-component system LytT family response regulator
MINALLIDDERLARNDLKATLQAFPEIHIAGEAANAAAGIKLIAQLQPDVIFLDIAMPEVSGFELLEKLEVVPEVIFTTAYDNYAIKAFEINALDYLLKPVAAHRLGDAIARLKNRLQLPPADRSNYLQEQEKIFVKDGDKCWFVRLSQILYFEAAGSYVKIHFDNLSPMVLRSMNSLEERLDPQCFFRTSRQHIVNLNHIRKMSTTYNSTLLLEMTNGVQIEVSRRQSARFRELRSI